MYPLVHFLQSVFGRKPIDFNFRQRGKTGTSGGALPPQQIDTPNGRVNYLSTLSNPREIQTTRDAWSAPRVGPPFAFDATGLRGGTYKLGGDIGHTPMFPTPGNIQMQQYSLPHPSVTLQNQPYGASGFGLQPGIGDTDSIYGGAAQQFNRPQNNIRIMQQVYGNLR